MRRVALGTLLLSLGCGGIWASARIETLIEGADKLDRQLNLAFPPGPEHDALAAYVQQYWRDIPTGRISLVGGSFFETTFESVISDGRLEDYEKTRLRNEYDALVRGPKGKLPGDRTDLIESSPTQSP